MAKKETVNKEKIKKVKEKKSQSKLLIFFNDTKEELGKVVWPSRQQLISESVAVMLMVTLVGTTIYLVDKLFIWVSGRVFG